MKNTIKRVVALYAFTSTTALLPTTKLREHLGLDMLDYEFIRLALEEIFHIYTNHEEFKALSTVDDVVNYVEKLVH